MQAQEEACLPETPIKDMGIDFPLTSCTLEDLEFAMDAKSFKRGRKNSEENGAFCGFPYVSLSSKYALAAMKIKVDKEETLRYLREQQISSDDNLATEWIEVERMFKERLWNELSLKVFALSRHPSLQNQDAQILLYENLTSQFDLKIDPLTAIAITEPLIDNVHDKRAVLDFLCYLMMKYQDCEEVATVIGLLRGETYLYYLNDLFGAEMAVVELRNAKLPTSRFIDVVGRFYMLASRFYKRVRNYREYFFYGMQALHFFMKYVPEKWWHNEAFCLCVAAIAADTIYDVRPLLDHPILESLKKATDYWWLADLLKFYNSGNVHAFLLMENSWKKVKVFVERRVEIHFKIAVIGIMEMILKGHPLRKKFSLREISERTAYTREEAERVILKAFARNIVKGTIDQVTGEINIAWVRPRMRCPTEISKLAQEVSDWISVIAAMELFVETELRLDEHSPDFIIRSAID